MGRLLLGGGFKESTLEGELYSEGDVNGINSLDFYQYLTAVLNFVSQSIF
jgi:hypothetical protein